MKNFEKYKDAIIDFLNNASCRDCTRNCDACILSMLDKQLGVFTRYELEQWLNEEYVEPIQLTHDEYVILKNLDKEIKFIARNKGEVLIASDVKPCKNYDYEIWTLEEDGFTDLLYPFRHLFQFIKWEDEEPYSIQKLIEDYEKENKENDQ